MSSLIKKSPHQDELSNLANRYEALVRDLGILREMEEPDRAKESAVDICSWLVGAITRAEGAEHSSIMALDPQSNCLVLCAVGIPFSLRGFSVTSDTWQGKQFRLGEGIAGHVAATRTHLRLDDTETDSRFLPLESSPITIRSLMCYPLVAGDRLLGVLNLSHSAPGYFSPDREQTGWLLARRASALIAAAPGQRIALEPETAASGKTVILLVDDEASLLSLGEAIMTRLGYTALTAEGGQEALAIVGKKSPVVDLAIVDVNMPEMGGREVLARLATLDPSLPVILTSGDVQEDFSSSGRPKPSAFLQKPYLVATLAEAVQSVLERPRR
jgi:CheY-like chemotaxis protein